MFMQLTEKLYWYPWQGQANNCNSIIYKSNQTILFDPGHIYNDFNESCLETLRRQVEAEVRKESGARFGINRGDEFILEAITQHYASRSGRELPDLKPDFYLEEGELALNPQDGAGEIIKVIASPGHSPGCVCFYLPGEKTLISGDTIFQNSIGRTDLPGGDMKIMGSSVDKLSVVEDVELLLPGHMGYVQGKEAVAHNFAQIKQYFFG